MVGILKDKVVMVTGGTGSIGSELVTRCLALEARRVIVFARDEIKHFTLKKRLSDLRLENVVGDMRDIRSAEIIFDRTEVDVIYHAAAMKHVVMCEDYPWQAVETNVLGTQNIVNLALRYKVPKMIAISTDKAAYPVNVMGASKFIAERVVLNANRASARGQAFSCVRFGNVAISRGSVIPIYIDNLLRCMPIEVTDPEVTRFIIGIPEATNLVLKASENARGGEIFILKMKAFRLGDLVEVVRERIAPRLDIPSRDVEVKVIGRAKGEKLHEDLINDTESRRLYELNNMYVILENSETALYPGIKRAELREYTSKSVPLISRDEIEAIIVDYLQNYLALGRM